MFDKMKIENILEKAGMKKSEISILNENRLIVKFFRSLRNYYASQGKSSEITEEKVIAEIKGLVGNKNKNLEEKKKKIYEKTKELTEKGIKMREWKGKRQPHCIT